MICKKCSVTGCEDCITFACGFHAVPGNVIGMCPMCRKEISINDMIHISKDIELIDIVNDKFGVVEENINVEVPQTERKKIDEHDEEDIDKRTKVSALLDIIYGKLPVEFRQVNVKIEQLQSGKKEIIESSHNYRKIVVFTSYEESIELITKALNLRNITFWRLAGNAANINHVSRKFNTFVGNAVLIINSSKHCAGLNLQSADWLIYFHKVLEKSVEAQIAGRGQRLGRASTLKIGYLLHKNEVSHVNIVSELE